MNPKNSYQLTTRQIAQLAFSVLVIYYPILLYVNLSERTWSFLVQSLPFLLKIRFEDRFDVIIDVPETTLPVDYSLDKLTTLLNPKLFFRVSRQFLVTLPAIQTIHAYSAGKWRLDLQPKARLEVFVSGDRVADLKEWLGK